MVLIDSSSSLLVSIVYVKYVMHNFPSIIYILRVIYELLHEIRAIARYFMTTKRFKFALILFSGN